MELSRGSVADPDAVIEATPDVLVAVAYGGRKFAEAVRAGDMKVEGDKALAKQFFSLFPLPEPAKVS
jgi:putative sterol carrier protein